ncbi:DNA adenine methylase [Streptococcus parasuis]|uniref:DNA adenine methylase n=1 Tax=Streptococcus parasuis TaxID=1501662 RepID=UPI0025A5A83F|nr:DNA adenine methylase [Streptococcus parasuis]WJQ86110.1 DNA adenine methylase [Streptococcus parasuis]
MLKLDEKKIRKGKPLGLPYQGSKKKISKKIVEIIKQNFGTDKVIYDVFGGGGAITAECLLNNLNVIYNDLNKEVTDMFQRVISQDREWIKTLIVSREEFFEIKNKVTKTVDDNLKLLINSFGNNKRTYLYSEEWSDMKYNLAIEIINKHDVFSGYKQTDIYRKTRTVNGDQLGQLQRLQQLERLQQLGQLQPTNLSYEAFSNVEGAIFYLDPPYENTTHETYNGEFDSQKFYDWAYKMSKKNIVIVSSYEISDDRFKCVYEFEKARSTIQSGTAVNRTEKLFMVV